MPVGSMSAGPDQGGQGEGGGGQVAAGGGDQGGAGQGVAEQLGDAEHRLAEQLGVAVLLAVPARVERRGRADGSRRPGRRSCRPACAALAPGPARRRGAGPGRPGRARRPLRGRRGRDAAPGRRPPGSGRGRLTRPPAWVSAVASTTSKAGWPAASRNSSTPAYPDAPKTPTWQRAWSRHSLYTVVHSHTRADFRPRAVDSKSQGWPSGSPQARGYRFPWRSKSPSPTRRRAGRRGRLDAWRVRSPRSSATAPGSTAGARRWPAIPGSALARLRLDWQLGRAGGAGGHRVDGAPADGGQLRLLQGAVHGPEPQPEGQAAPARPRLARRGRRRTSQTASRTSPPACAERGSHGQRGTASSTTKARSMSLTPGTG